MPHDWTALWWGLGIDGRWDVGSWAHNDGDYEGTFQLGDGCCRECVEEDLVCLHLSGLSRV